MGLSRNKVAVSEGAAGSPPFYGDTDTFSRMCRIVSRQNVMSKRSTVKAECFDLGGSIFSDRGTPKWGCSSVGRAPALQAGGHGFESHHLHHRQCRSRAIGSTVAKSKAKRKGERDEIHRIT